MFCTNLWSTVTILIFHKIHKELFSFCFELKGGCVTDKLKFSKHAQNKETWYAVTSKKIPISKENLTRAKIALIQWLNVEKPETWKIFFFSILHILFIPSRIYPLSRFASPFFVGCSQTFEYYVNEKEEYIWFNFLLIKKEGILLADNEVTPQKKILV